LKNMANEEEWCILCMSFACSGAMVVSSNVLAQHERWKKTDWHDDGSLELFGLRLCMVDAQRGSKRYYHKMTFRQFTTLSLVSISPYRQ
jgi:hypothetical protein